MLIQKSTTLQNVPWLCESMQEESCTISCWSSTATSAVNNRAAQPSQIKLVMTEAANSFSAAAGPELSITRNPVANLQ